MVIATHSHSLTKQYQNPTIKRGQKQSQPQDTTLSQLSTSNQCNSPPSSLLTCSQEISPTKIRCIFLVSLQQIPNV
jgi:hypothetical protein